MPFTEDDKTLIKNYTCLKIMVQFTRVISRFSMKNWMKDRLDTLLKKLKETGNTD